MRVIATHRCRKRHRSAAAFIHCVIPGAEWVRGKGSIALLLWCDDTPRVALFGFLSHARTVESEYRVFGCCAACTNDHELVGIDFDAAIEEAHA